MEYEGNQIGFLSRIGQSAAARVGATVIGGLTTIIGGVALPEAIASDKERPGIYAREDIGEPINLNLRKGCGGVFRIENPKLGHRIPVEYSFADLLSKFVDGTLIITKDDRPVLLTNTGLWVEKSEREGEYVKYGVSPSGYIYLLLLPSKEGVERMQIPQDLERLVQKMKQCSE